MTDTDATPPPQGGWSPLEAGPFEALTGQLYKSTQDLGPDEPIRIGLRIAPKHCNAGNFCHGGMMATFLDMALGLTISTGAKAEGDSTTMGLTIDYLRAALPGEWIESRSRLLHTTWRTGYCDTVVLGPNGPVARASGIFKIGRPKKA